VRQPVTSSTTLVNDAAFDVFVATLASESDAFRNLWSRHALATPASWEKVIVHPTRGRLAMVYTSLRPDSEPPDVRIITYLRTPDAVPVIGSHAPGAPSRSRGRR
jgi:hypothetical protein